jgi:HEPN domain-containing protein
MHPCGDDSQLEFWMGLNGAERRLHQAEFSAGAGDEADAAFLFL